MALNGGYEHITSYNYLQDEAGENLRCASLCLLRYIQDLPKSDSESTAADVFDAIVVAIQSILEHCTSKKTGKELKYAKTIYLFTDARSPINEDGMEAVISEIRRKDIEFVLCGFDFDTGTESNDSSAIKKANEKILRQFESRFVDGNDALAIMRRPKKKIVEPSATASVLTLGKKVKIDIKLYAKTMEQKPLNAKKFSTISDSSNTDGGKVTTIRKYVIKTEKEEEIKNEEDDEHYIDEKPEEEVPKEDLINAYRYGKTLIPFSQDDEEATSLRTFKGMDILGFLYENEVVHF